MTSEELQALKDRAKLLEQEMDANEEENRIMQDELDSLYAQIDKEEGN